MTSQKLGIAAVTFEIAAWGTTIFDTGNDVRLFAYLSLHLLASLLLALALSALLSTGNLRQRGMMVLLIAACSYAIPVAGFLGMLIGTLMLQTYRKAPEAPEFKSAELPDFDQHQKHHAGFRQTGLRSFLNNSAAPMSTRMGAMVALQYVSGRISAPLLRDLLSDQDEDIRLLAYGMLDNQEKRINRAIDDELKALAQSTSGENGAAPDAETPERVHRLSDLYWELVYQELAQGDLRDYAINQSLHYCEWGLRLVPDNAALTLRHGRLLHCLGHSKDATAKYRRALELGLHATRVIPYQAELCFEQRDFAGVRRLMQELGNEWSLPRLQPIIDYWSIAR